MSVIVESVSKGSPAYKMGIQSGDTLVTINEHEIMDVLDYRFYQNEEILTLNLITDKGAKAVKIKKDEYEELGLLFSTYLIDQQRSCKNKCVFCFIDQLPKGLRPSLYFKDDDSRLSFLFGNYITLTNITEHEVDRIIKMHISPINISVHTTNPELRVKMMNNRFAGDALSVLNRLSDAGITINCQLVVCPGYNDGDELKRSLGDLLALPTVECVAAVPVGLTRYRDGLSKLNPFDKYAASDVLSIIDAFGTQALEKYGSRRIFAADEFYILAEKEIPDADYYEEFMQLENGVGLWALLLSEATKAMSLDTELTNKREVSIATGEAAYPLIRKIVDKAEEKWHNLSCKVYPIKNDFFGGHITVTGLVTGGDIIRQLKDKPLGDQLIIPSAMLRSEGDLFLDDTTLNDLSKALSVDVKVVTNDGYELIDAVLGV